MLLSIGVCVCVCFSLRHVFVRCCFLRCNCWNFFRKYEVAIYTIQLAGKRMDYLVDFAGLNRTSPRVVPCRGVRTRRRQQVTGRHALVLPSSHSTLCSKPNRLVRFFDVCTANSSLASSPEHRNQTHAFFLQGFELVLDLLDDACQGLLERCREGTA